MAAHAVRLGHNKKALSHLIMKTPFHAMNLETLFETFGEKDDDLWLVGTTRPLDKQVWLF